MERMETVTGGVEIGRRPGGFEKDSVESRAVNHSGHFQMVYTSKATATGKCRYSLQGQQNYNCTACGVSNAHVDNCIGNLRDTKKPIKHGPTGQVYGT